MNIALFYHSLVSDWNHGNAHFLRGVATELVSRGNKVTVYEPADGWSYENLVRDHGTRALDRFRDVYPKLDGVRYRQLEVDEVLDGVDLAIVHEWNSHDLVRRIGEYRRRHSSVVLFFHDTHHRVITAEAEMGGYDLSEYDGVLAYGRVLREVYLHRGWARRAWVWHEAADPRVFAPRRNLPRDLDLVWVGNWGDDERTAELHEYLIEPARDLRLRAEVFGVRYPEEAKRALAEAGIRYRGWAANVEVPEIFARARATVHVPRRAYVTALRGIPTIRPFEAMACGIPLVCAPWEDAEQLFRPGEDYLVARSGQEMREHLSDILANPVAADAMAARGRETILSRHTCAHRVDELLAIYGECRQERSPAGLPAAGDSLMQPPARTGSHPVSVS